MPTTCEPAVLNFDHRLTNHHHDHAIISRGLKPCFNNFSFTCLFHFKLYSTCALWGQPLRQQHRNGHTIRCLALFAALPGYLASKFRLPVFVPFVKFCLACITHLTSARCGWKRCNLFSPSSSEDLVQPLRFPWIHGQWKWFSDRERQLHMTCMTPLSLGVIVTCDQAVCIAWQCNTKLFGAPSQ